MKKIISFSIAFTWLYFVTGQSSSNCLSSRYISEVFSQVTVSNNITYANARAYAQLFNADLKMDIYQPAGDTLSLRPLIVYMFGGAFLIGDKQQPPIPDYATHFAKRGYVVACINYRIGFNTADGNSVIRAVYRAIQDLRAALRFLAQNRQTYRIDLNNIFTTGSSAGCVTALHNVFMTEADRPQATFGSLLEPSDLGCMNCSGNNFYNNQNVPVKGIINHWGAITDTSFIVPSRAVPILSIHGTNDGIVPYHTGQPFQLPIWPTVMGSYEIKQRMNHIHATNILYPLYGAGHEPEILTSNVYLDTMYQQGEPFLYELIRPHTGNISGPVSAHQTETQTYSVASHHGSLYCWEVTGGAITGNSGNQINIRWDSLGIQTIKVREKNYLNASGDSVIYIVNISPLLYTNMPSSSNNVAVYPNPVDKVLTLYLSSDFNAQPIEVRIFSTNGTVLLTQQTTIDSGEINVNTSFLPSGIYWLRIVSGTKESSVKFIKQ